MLVPALNPTTCALTPEVEPVIVTGEVSLKNWLRIISSPPKVEASCKEKYDLEKEAWPGIT